MHSYQANKLKHLKGNTTMNIEQSYASDITVTDKYIIKHDGFNIDYVKCRITGKFVKHMLAKNELMFSSIERYKTMLVLLLCVSANIIGFSLLMFK